GRRSRSSRPRGSRRSSSRRREPHEAASSFHRRAVQPTCPGARIATHVRRRAGNVVDGRNAKRERNRRLAIAVVATVAAGLLAAQAWTDEPGRTKADADDGQWVRAARDYASTRYSGLTQITSGNARQLRLAWSFHTGVERG